MDLDELRSVQSKERTKDSLQHLRDSFYEDVAAYLAERKRQRDERAAGVDNPFSDERVRRLSDEIETAEAVVESLYERRVGKVVKLSSFAAAGAPTDTEGMTVQEAELFEDLVVRIEQNKGRVLDVLEDGADVDIDVDGDAGSATANAERDVAGPTPDAATEAAVTGAGDGGPEPQGGVLAEAMGGGATNDEPTPTTNSPGTDAAADATDGDSLESGNADPDRSEGAESAAAPNAGGPAEEFVPGSEPDQAGGTASPSPSNDAGSVDDAGSPSAAVPTTAATDPGTGATAGSSATADRRTVRITRDVGQILGVDEREYELANDDVVTLPTANADPLVQRDAAEPIE